MHNYLVSSSYWAKRFLKYGYVGNQQVAVWYRQNIFIYADSQKLYLYPELQKYYLENRESTIFDAVHPEIWIGRLMHFQNTVQKFNAYLEHITQKK